MYWPEAYVKRIEIVVQAREEESTFTAETVR